MELIGRINRRKIYYLQIRNNSKWKSSLPKDNWLAFTIANNEDEELVPPLVKICIDHNVGYTCSAGELASMTEQYFDEEICWRGVQYEEKKGKDYDYGQTPVTTMHLNFSEGFWFSTIVANNGSNEIRNVVCIDFTKRKVKKHLIGLINKINKGWLPSEEEVELAVYDH